MIFREATIDDIEQIFVVRYAVEENRLSDSDLVNEQECESYLTVRGKGWVCEIDNRIAGFAIADLKDHNIWALFVLPAYEKRGIGQQLQRIMLEWYFLQTQDTVWLGTNPDTRAESFYRKSGWKEVGIHGDGEIKFEMTYRDWLEINQSNPQVE